MVPQLLARVGCTVEVEEAPLNVRGAAAVAGDQVVDPASNKAYWWDTDTNETRWEAPPDAAAPAPPPPGLGNEALLEVFLAYLLSPAAKFDYPAPSGAFMDLVEAHRCGGGRGGGWGSQVPTPMLRHGSTSTQHSGLGAREREADALLCVLGRPRPPAAAPPPGTWQRPEHSIARKVRRKCAQARTVRAGGLLL